MHFVLRRFRDCGQARLLLTVHHSVEEAVSMFQLVSPMRSTRDALLVLHGVVHARASRCLP
jgi:hypothetical protein